MGTTLANIHVYTDKEADIRNIVPDTYQVKSISSNWVSIFGDTEFIITIVRLSYINICV